MDTVNTKVDMRFPISTVDWVPANVKVRLREQHPNKINKKDEFVVASDRHRTQHKNLEDCIDKLHNTIVEAAETLIVREPSEETVERVVEFKRVEKEKKMKAKERHGAKKANRKRGRDDY
ncbi:hypothetical protein HKX48_002672 [Thoreauomyces humboldtii]|nr:hypothetical protein HKX48_002672 [Thoreauomyces humboldtii]